MNGPLVIDLHTVVLYALPLGLGVLGFLILVLFLLLRSESASRDKPESWGVLQKAFDLQEDPESPRTLKGRWEANPLKIHFLPGEGNHKPRLLLVLEAKLSGFPRTNLRRESAAGSETSFERDITIDQDEGEPPAIWNNQEVRRYVRLLLESRTKMILLREDGLGLEWILENDLQDEETIEKLGEQLEWLSQLLQQLQRIQSSQSGKKSSYPFNS